jgi:hypothetical protein
MPLSHLRTTTEAARRLEVTSRWISTLVKREDLEPAIKLPGKTGAYLFTTDELERYAAERDAAHAAHAADEPCAKACDEPPASASWNGRELEATS